MPFIFRKRSLLEEKPSKTDFSCVTFHLRYMIVTFAEETREERRKSTASNFSVKIEVEKNVLNDSFSKIKGKR